MKKLITFSTKLLLIFSLNIICFPNNLTNKKFINPDLSLNEKYELINSTLNDIDNELTNNSTSVID